MAPRGQMSSSIKTRLVYRVNHFMWDEITYPSPNLNVGLTELPLKFEHGWVIALYAFKGV